MLKRSKKLACIALTAFSVAAMTGCNDVTKNDDGDIITFTYNNETSITTKDIVEKYLNEDRNSHASAIYDALYEIVVRASFEDKGVLSEFKSKVEKAADEDVETAKDNADSADQSWEDYLAGQGYDKDELTVAEMEKEYRLSCLYTQMTKIVDEQFYEKFKGYDDGIHDNDALQQKYNLINGSEGYLKNYVPYHVKHILVQNEASQEYGYSRGHISADNAEKLYQVVQNLVEGHSFSDVANRFTDDPGNDGSNGTKNGGEYIMATDAGFVNEFQLGIYVWDLLLNSNNYADPDYDYKLEKLHLDADSKVKKQVNSIVDYGVNFIPYGVVEKMYEVKDTTKKNGEKINNDDQDYYPRNIYFNKYFQNRNIGFITDDACLTTADFLNGNDSWADTEIYTKGLHTRSDDISGTSVWNDLGDDGRYLLSGTQAASLSGKTQNFKSYTFGSGEDQITKNILCDTDGNPILVVRNKESSTGVHFIVIERSGFDVSDTKFDAAAFAQKTDIDLDEVVNNKSKYATSLNEYYAPISPKNVNGKDPNTGKPYWLESFPHVEMTTASGAKYYAPKKTYVQTVKTETIAPADAFVDNSVTAYQTRVDTLSTNIKKAVNSWNKYYWLNDYKPIELEKLELLNDYDLSALVKSYIDKEELSKKKTLEKDFDDKWVNYADSLEKQDEERKYSLLPEVLAADWGDPSIYTKGAPGYNSKYHDVSE